MKRQIEVEDFGASLAEDIKNIKKALSATLVNDKALVILLAEAAGVKRDDVRRVLAAARTLDSRYLK